MAGTDNRLTEPQFGVVGFDSGYVTKTVTIASGQTVSAAVDLGGLALVGIDVPAVTGATLGFKRSADGVNYRTAKDESGAAITWVVASDELLYFSPPKIITGSIKLVSGQMEAVDRTFTLLLVP